VAAQRRFGSTRSKSSRRRWWCTTFPKASPVSLDPPIDV
jgi:hypothetical protein